MRWLMVYDDDNDIISERHTGREWEESYRGKSWAPWHWLHIFEYFVCHKKFKSNFIPFILFVFHLWCKPTKLTLTHDNLRDKNTKFSLSTLNIYHFFMLISISFCNASIDISVGISVKKKRSDTQTFCPVKNQTIPNLSFSRARWMKFKLILSQWGWQNGLEKYFAMETSKQRVECWLEFRLSVHQSN